MTTDGGGWTYATIIQDVGKNNIFNTNKPSLTVNSFDYKYMKQKEVYWIIGLIVILVI